LRPQVGLGLIRVSSAAESAGHPKHKSALIPHPLPSVPRTSAAAGARAVCRCELSKNKLSGSKRCDLSVAEFARIKFLVTGLSSGQLSYGGRGHFPHDFAKNAKICRFFSAAVVEVRRPS